MRAKDVITETHLVVYRRKTTLSNRQSLGPKVKALREEYGTLRDVAAETGLSISTISRFERGYETGVGEVLKLLKLLGCFVCGPDGDEL